jgi:hypothetical protein
MHKKAHDPRVLDKRVVERSIQKGVITRADFEKHLASLPDRASASESIAPLVYQQAKTPVPVSHSQSGSGTCKR